MLSFEALPCADPGEFASPGKSTPSPIGSVIATDCRLFAFSAAETDEAGGFRRQNELLEEAAWAWRTRALRKSTSDVVAFEEALLESEVDDMNERMDEILMLEWPFRCAFGRGAVRSSSRSCSWSASGSKSKLALEILPPTERSNCSIASRNSSPRLSRSSCGGSDEMRGSGSNPRPPIRGASIGVGSSAVESAGPAVCPRETNRFVRGVADGDEDGMAEGDGGASSGGNTGDRARAVSLARLASIRDGSSWRSPGLVAESARRRAGRGGLDFESFTCPERRIASVAERYSSISRAGLRTTAGPLTLVGTAKEGLSLDDEQLQETRRKSQRWRQDQAQIIERHLVDVGVIGQPREMITVESVAERGSESVCLHERARGPARLT